MLRQCIRKGEEMKKLIRILKTTPNKNFVMMNCAFITILIKVTSGISAPYAKTTIAIALIAFLVAWLMPLQTYNIKPWPLIGVVVMLAGLWVSVLFPIGILLFFIAVFLQKEENIADEK